MGIRSPGLKTGANIMDIPGCSITKRAKTVKENGSGGSNLPSPERKTSWHSAQGYHLNHAVHQVGDQKLAAQRGTLFEQDLGDLRAFERC